MLKWDRKWGIICNGEYRSVLLLYFYIFLFYVLEGYLGKDILNLWVICFMNKKIFR